MESENSQVNEQKVSNAIRLIKKKFDDFIEKIMKMANLNDFERMNFHQSFQYVAIEELQHLRERIHRLQNTSSTIPNSVIMVDDIEARNKSIGTIVGQEKMKKARKILIDNLENFLTDQMIAAKFCISQCRKNHPFFYFVLSRTFTTFENMIQHETFQFKSKDKNADIDEKIDSKDFATAFPNADLNLIVKTRKHSLYHFSTLTDTFILKVLNCESSEKAKKNICNEYKISMMVHHPALRASFTRTTYQGKQALVLKYIEGVTVNNLKFEVNFNIYDFLLMAREIVSGVLAIHQKNLMHLNLSSCHVIYNSRTKLTKIIGNGSCACMTKSDHICNDELVEMDIRYLSPEQCSRIKQKINFQSDFYSLGVILYKVLTGDYPFVSDNKFDLMCKQLLQNPKAVALFNENIPNAISEMISKLLNKKKEYRYQSAKGIIYDLDLMIAEYEKDQSLSGIVLAEHDRAENIVFMKKLYGREKEMKKLFSVFEKVSKHSFQVTVISGVSGSGKSALAFEIYEKVLQKRGFFLHGKFDQTVAAPHSALLQAVNCFCEDLFLRDKVTVKKYKGAAIRAVGEEGKLITDLVPKLQLLIGLQPDTSNEFGKEARHKFNFVLLNFFKSIASIGYPIVLFLDDLQWSDVQTLNFLSALINDGEIKNLMLLGVYRTEEIGENHYSLKFLEEVKKNAIIYTSIHLDNLIHEVVNSIISDALQLPPLETYTLSALVHKKTLGNPYFISQMLKSLEEQNLIFFCAETSRWQWDSLLKSESEIAGCVLELLRRKILLLSRTTQEALKIASCLGSPFSLSDLALITSNKIGVEDALTTGILMQNKGGNTAQFAHDQAQQAAFSLLPKDSKKVFLYIGRKLWKLLKPEELEEKLFLIYNLISKALELVSERTERRKIVSLFYYTGKKALSATAFELALNIFTKGISLLDPHSWNNDYALTLTFYDNAAQAAFCCGNIRRMHELILSIAENGRSSLDLVHSKHLQIKVFNENALYDEAVKIGIKILRDIGENVVQDDRLAVEVEIQNAKNLISGRTDDEILSMKVMKETAPISKMMIYRDLLSSLFYTNQSLLSWVSARMIKITFENGFSKYSSSGFCAIGSILSGMRDKTAFRLGKLGLAFLRKANVKEAAPYDYIMFYCFISPFFSTVQCSFQPLSKSYRISQEVGMMELALMSADNYIQYAFFGGRNLHKLIDEIEEFQCVKKNPFILSTHQAVVNLLNTPYDSSMLCGEIFDFKSFLDQDKKESFRVRILLLCSVIAYLFRDYDSAYHYMEQQKPIRNFIAYQYHYPISVFYEGLILAAMLHQSLKDKKGIDRLYECISSLKVLTENSTDYLNKVRLLEAELATIKGEKSSITKYNEAILLSERYGFKNEQAIANECAGQYFLKQGSPNHASKYLFEALACYKEYGAISKVKDLLRNHSNILKKRKSSQNQIGMVPFELVGHASVSCVSEVTIATLLSSKHKKRVRFSID